MKYSKNQVGWVYKRSYIPSERDELMSIIGGAVGLLGIFVFMAALAILPWWVL